MGRRIEVGRAAEQCRQLGRDRVHHLAAGDARRHAFGVGRKGSGSPRPSRSGSSSRRRVPSSRASSGNAAAYAASRWFHSASARSPRGSAARKRSSAAAGTRNGGSTGQAELLLRLRDVGRAERRAVRLERVLHRRAEAEVGSHQDQRRSRGLAARSGQRRVDRVDVVAVGDPDRLPAIGLEAPGAIFRERDVGAGGERHRVVVVEADQLAETEMAGERCRFRRDAFHQVAVAGDDPGAVIDRRVAVAAVTRGQMRFADRHADGVREALAERTGRDLDARRVAALGMARRLAAPLAELLQIVERKVVAGDVEQAVEQRRAVAGREHEAIAVGPERIRRMVLEVARPQHVGHRRGAERQPGVAAVGLLHHVDREEAQRVDALQVERVCHGSLPLLGIVARAVVLGVVLAAARGAIAVGAMEQRRLRRRRVVERGRARPRVPAAGSRARTRTTAARAAGRRTSRSSCSAAPMPARRPARPRERRFPRPPPARCAASTRRSRRRRRRAIPGRYSPRPAAPSPA